MGRLYLMALALLGGLMGAAHAAVNGAWGFSTAFRDPNIYIFNPTVNWTGTVNPWTGANAALWGSNDWMEPLGTDPVRNQIIFPKCTVRAWFCVRDVRPSPFPRNPSFC